MSKLFDNLNMMLYNVFYKPQYIVFIQFKYNLIKYIKKMP